MSEEIGAGSPKGKRYFVSKFPELSLTMVPADWVTNERGQERKQKPVRLAFIKQVKPWKYQGDGMLGSHNPTGTDRNDSQYHGVYVVEDPGENPSTDKEKRARDIIDFLRGHEYYRKTSQDNQLEANPWLKELSWDPRSLDQGSGVSVMARGRERLSNPGVSAPEETRMEKPSARVPQLSKK